MAGIGMIEFLIALPVMLILIMAAAEFGRAFMQYNTLTKSTRDAARFVSNHALFGSTGVVVLTPGLLTETQNLLVYGDVGTTGTPLLPGLVPADVTVTSDGAGNVTVGATYGYTPIFSSLPMFTYGSARSTGFTFRSSMTVRAL